MKKVKLLLMAGAFMLATATTAFSQEAPKPQAKANNAREIKKFEAGKKLDANDLGFLDLIFNSDGGKSRGKNTEVEVAGHHLHADHVLTDAEAGEISAKVNAYNEKNKPAKVKEEDAKSRGANECYYYCYYNSYEDYICYWYCY